MENVACEEVARKGAEAGREAQYEKWLRNYCLECELQRKRLAEQRCHTPHKKRKTRQMLKVSQEGAQGWGSVVSNVTYSPQKVSRQGGLTSSRFIQLIEFNAKIIINQHS